MSQQPPAAADQTAPGKKGKGKKLLIVAGGILLAGGGGAAAAVYTGAFGLGAKAHVEEDPDQPKLLLRAGGEVAAPRGAARLDPGKYKATYYTLEQNFMSNLRDSDAFAQVSLGVSTFYDHHVIDNLKDNEMPVRSAVLLVLADQDPFAIATPQGKKLLQRNLKVAINDVLKDKAGFGGIDDVYFTSFIIQCATPRLFPTRKPMRSSPSWATRGACATCSRSRSAARRCARSRGWPGSSGSASGSRATCAG